MIIDAHVHCSGQERTTEVLQSLDDAGIDMAVLLAPFLSEGFSLDDPQSLVRANEHVASLVRGEEDRLVGFAVVDPRDPNAPQLLRHAVQTLGLRGCKMVPTGWYPYDREVQPVFAVAHELEIPLLFHSGIFIDGRNGRFCRPTFFEALRDFPGLRVTLAHLGWPWTDEAIAVGLIDLIHGVPHNDVMFRFDLSFGPPPPYRLETLSKALQVLGPGLLQFASDCFLPCSGAHIAERRGWVVDLLDELKVDEAGRERIWWGTAAAWLGLDIEAGAPSKVGQSNAAAAATRDAAALAQRRATSALLNPIGMSPDDPDFIHAPDCLPTTRRRRLFSDLASARDRDLPGESRPFRFNACC
ncbi:MAG: hypothetical protein JWP52_908 [Rhizobacter sp.]|nr:hypothetical protein [Rhizobacter sp.]